MAVGGVWVSLLLMAGTVAAVALCRLAARRRPGAFLLEALSTFQICACTNELCLLAGAELQPPAALALTYVFTVLHGLTLAGSTCNPCGTLQQIWADRVSLEGGGLRIGAQFAAALLARGFMHLIWSLEMAEPHSEAFWQGCSNPLQTTLTQAFFIELLFSAVFQLAVLQLDTIHPNLRVHFIALLITMLVYSGGNLTGAIFNPALAFSLHPYCFYDRFLSYSLVYWIAPSLGTILVAFVWDEIVPRIS
ncbi:aquaporin-11 [Rhea pennata]|uniref:aquaporin-11 n=1 Tax=Rhea pennata TaxID=8795 RepID=UPI002E25C130